MDIALFIVGVICGIAETMFAFEAISKHTKGYVVNVDTIEIKGFITWSDVAHLAMIMLFLNAILMIN